MTTVAGYELHGVIGVGGSSTVWRATAPDGRSIVALKRVRAPGAAPAAVDTLRREAAVLAAIAHPNVVRMLEVVPDGDAIALALDFAPNGSLAALLHRRGWLDPGEVVAVLVPLAGALAAVHAAGLVHGDIRPANVLFAADGRPMLTDFGLARHTSSAASSRAPAARADVAALAALATGSLARGAVPIPVAPVATALDLIDALRAAVAPRLVRLPPTAPLDARASAAVTAADGTPTPTRRAAKMQR
jgi:serine/threonine protein kinase